MANPNPAPVQAPSTVEERLKFLEAQNAKLQGENQQLRETARKPLQGLTLRVSEKKGLSVYGLGRWPVTLYKSQWLRLLGEADRIGEFIKAHGSELAERE